MVKIKTKIIYWGEGLNSPKPERRFKYFIVMEDGRMLLKPEEIDTLRGKLEQWVWYPIIQYEYVAYEPWFYKVRCEHCYRRFLYEHEKLKNGEWVWKRSMCLRHYILDHLNKLKTTDTNRPRALVIENDKAFAIIESVNYRYKIEIDIEKATIRLRYKGKEYVFTYRNHTNAYPYMSSYQFIRALMFWIFDEILESAQWNISAECDYRYNYLINQKHIPICKD